MPPPSPAQSHHKAASVPTPLRLHRSCEAVLIKSLEQKLLPNSCEALYINKCSREAPLNKYRSRKKQPFTTPQYGWHHQCALTDSRARVKQFPAAAASSRFQRQAPSSFQAAVCRWSSLVARLSSSSASAEWSGCTLRARPSRYRYCTRSVCSADSEVGGGHWLILYSCIHPTKWNITECYQMGRKWDGINSGYSADILCRVADLFDERFNFNLCIHLLSFVH